MAATYFYITLYVAGGEPNSGIALNNLQEICSGNLKEICDVKIVDVFEEFEKALKEKIVVTPTLIVKRKGSKIKTRFFGNLKKKEGLIDYLAAYKNE